MQVMFLEVTLVFSLFIASSQGNNEDESLKRHWMKDPNWKEFDWKKEWSDYKHCKVEKVCPDYDEKCADGVGWPNFTKIMKDIGRNEIEIIDLSSIIPLIRRPPFQNDFTHHDFDQHKSDICHLVIVSNKRNRKNNNDKNCKFWQTQDRCPWIPKSDYEDSAGHSLGSMNFTIDTTEYNCKPMPIECNPDVEEFPTSCLYGPGWKGELKTTVENGQFFIDWTALVQQQSCVEWVTLIDKKTSKSKSIWGTESDVNLPIRYMNKTCDMKIFVYGYKGEGASCYTVEAKVPCEKDKSSECDKESDSPTSNAVKESDSSTSNAVKESDSSTSNAVAISLSVTAVVVIIIIVASIVIIVLKRKSTVDQENSGREQSELNDTYGTYYQVCLIKCLIRIKVLEY